MVLDASSIAAHQVPVVAIKQVAFYEGSTLGESVFSCLYAHTPALHHLMQACHIHRLNGQLVRGA